MIRFSSLLILSLLINANVRACDCEYGGPFLRMVPKTQFVALVKVTKYLTFKEIYGKNTPMSMEVEVVETYKGGEKRKKVTVWGDPGHLCRPYLSTFKEGEYYVIGFYPGNPNHGDDNEKATDYSISICGTYWLTVDIRTKIVSGDIGGDYPKSQKVSVEMLKSKLAGIDR
jgi:hypothetical protein